MENSKKKSTRKKDSKNYRLVIQEEKTYEEKFSLKLSRSNVFLIGTFISLIIISITTVIIFFISALILYFTPFEIQTNINGIFVRDTFSKFFQILILLSVSCLLFMSKQYLQKRL